MSYDIRIWTTLEPNAPRVADNRNASRTVAQGGSWLVNASAIARVAAEARSRLRIDGNGQSRSRSLSTTGSGGFPVRGYASRLSRIMDDQRERAPQRWTGDV